MNKKIGELLKETRQLKNLTLDQASDSLKINKSYLKAIEDGNYDIFPAEVYTKGFIQNYVKYLDIDADKAIRMFRRDRELSDKVEVVNHGSVIGGKVKQRRKFTINRVTVSIGLAIAGLIAVLGFASYQVFIVQQKPYLLLTSPLEAKANTGEVFKYDTSQKKVTIKGEVGVGDNVFFNGEQVFTSGLPQFSIPNVELKNGDNEIVIESRNQFGVRSEIDLMVVKN